MAENNGTQMQAEQGATRTNDPATTNRALQIRRCRSHDFEDVLALLRQLWPNKTLDAKSLRTMYDDVLESDAHAYVCATDGAHVIAFGSLTLRSSVWQAGLIGYVDELVVDSPYRGAGIGTRLLEELVSLARQRGCRLVELDSGLHRKAAHRFYERNGFENRAYLFSKPL